MATVTADDIRVLARSAEDDPVLVLMDEEVAVVPAGQVGTARVVLTREGLVAEFGEDITDLEAEVLAAGLTAQVSEA